MEDVQDVAKRTLTVEQAAEYAYICHLPGHEAYGMVGTLRILER